VWVSVVITAVSIVIVTILLFRVVMADRTPDRGTRHAVMTGHMAQYSSNHSALYASGSQGSRRAPADQHEHSAENQHCFHAAPPF
jgi:hypothetical protein